MEMALTAQSEASNLIPHQEHEIPIHHWNFNPLVYERGYAMGYLNRSTVLGFPIRTLEGSLQLGVDSSDLTIIDPDCLARERGSATPMNAAGEAERNLGALSTQPLCQKEINPWRFSSMNLSMQKILETNTGRPVLVYYSGYRLVFFTSTYHIIKSIWPVVQDRPMPSSSYDASSTYPLSQLVHYGRGILEGRFVRANVVNNIRQNYEVSIQLGPAGDNFVDMNLASSDLYDYIVESMAVGQYVRIYYLELFNFQQIPASLVRGYATRFRIYRVDVIDGPNH